jgi:hypothetical protein
MPPINSKPNYSLLIQGPILSKGRTGKTFFNNELNKNSIVDYYCEDNIFKLISEFGYLFSKIRIITWDNEQINESRFSNFGNCSVLKLKNITPNLVIDNKKLPTDFNNKYKQFYSLSKGLESIKDDNSEYIIKVRTDQYLDISGLIQEHQKAISNNLNEKNKIFVPYINVSNYLPSDFYFVATKTIFTNFVDAMMWGNYTEFNSSVHIDMSLKYTYIHFREEIKIHPRTFFLNSFNKNPNKDKIILCNFLTTNIYSIFSSNIIDTVIWRGDKMELHPKETKSYAFSNNNINIILDVNNYKKSSFLDYLYINVPSYLIVRYPFIRDTFIHRIISRLFRTIKKIFK